MLCHAMPSMLYIFVLCILPFLVNKVVSLLSPYGIGQTIIFLPCGFFLLSSSFFVMAVRSRFGVWTGSEHAPNTFGASSEPASVMEFGFNGILPGAKFTLRPPSLALSYWQHRCKNVFYVFLFLSRFYVFNGFLFSVRFYNNKRWKIAYYAR